MSDNVRADLYEKAYDDAASLVEVISTHFNLLMSLSERYGGEVGKALSIASQAMAVITMYESLKEQLQPSEFEALKEAARKLASALDGDAVAAEDAPTPLKSTLN